MKNIKNVLAIIILFLPFQLFSQNPGDAVFSGIQVHTIKLKFTQANYWDSLKIYYAQGLEHMMNVDATVDGVEYKGVGVRLKGNSSYSHPNDKKSFKISFDEFNDELRWDGMKSVHLNNCWGDPSFMREKIHLDFCREAGIVAPRANYVRLYLNDELWGLYSLVEHVDKVFLKTRFGNKNGDLFKAADAFDKNGTAIISDFKWYGTADSSYIPRYELKTDESITAWPTLKTFLDSLNNNPNTVSIFQQKINVENYYKALSADILFSNLDSYLNSGRNFYFYFLPETNKMEWIIWDTGLSMGAYAVGVSKLETMSVTYVVNSTDRPLIGQIYNSASLKSNYLQTLCNLFTKYYTAAKLFPHIDSVSNAIRAYVNEDPRKMYTSLQFETNISSDIDAEGGGGTRKPGIKSFINLRQASVESQLSSLGITNIQMNEQLPPSFSLAQNYPNPFNPQTTISFQLPFESRVTLKVYDVLGKEISTLVNQTLSAGNHLVTFEASSLSSGIYFYKINAGNFVQTKRMMLIK